MSDSQDNWDRIYEETYLLEEDRLLKFYGYDVVRMLQSHSLRIHHVLLPELTRIIFKDSYRQSSDQLLLASWFCHVLNNFIDRLYRVAIKHNFEFSKAITRSNIELVMELPQSTYDSIYFWFESLWSQCWVMRMLEIALCQCQIEGKATYELNYPMHTSHYYRLRSVLDSVMVFAINKINILRKNNKILCTLGYGITIFDAIKVGCLIFKPKVLNKKKSCESVTSRAGLVNDIFLLLKRHDHVFLDLLNEINIKHNNDKIYQVFADWAVRSLPIYFFEELKERLDFFSSQYQALGRPGVLFSLNNWYHSEDFLFLAICARRVHPVAWISAQHGGVYGQIETFPLGPEVDASYLDCFYSWGWKSWPSYVLKIINRESNVKSLPSIILEEKTRKISENRNATPKKLLWVTTFYHDFTYRLGSWIRPEHFDKQWRDINKVAGICNPETFFVKTIKSKFHRNNRDRSLKLLTNIKPDHFLDVGECENLMAQSSLVIVDYLATSFIISMAANIPTIGYFNASQVSIACEASDVFNELKKVGVVFFSIDDLMGALPKIFNDPEKWWRSENVQAARTLFLSVFGYFSSNSKKQLFEELCKWKNIVREIQGKNNR